jgi:hypothetical protein
LAAALCWCVNAGAQTAIGQWRDHFPYLKTVAVVEGAGKAWCATRNAVFSVDPASGEVERITKVNALSDVDITSLAWNQAMGALLVGYGNGNIDMLRGGEVVNIGDIKRSNIIGDKGVRSFLSDGLRVHVNCGFGVVLVDLERLEVRDTWIIGPNGAQLAVNGLAFYQDSIYAATPSGLFGAARNNPNLAAYTSWTKRLDVPRPNGPFSDIATVGDRLFVNWDQGTPGVEQDTIYCWANGWSVLADANSRDVRTLSTSPDGQRLVVAMWFELRHYDQSLNRVFQGNAGFILAEGTGSASGGGWVASENLGLVRLNGDGTSATYTPNGPRTSGVVDMDIQRGWLQVATGSVAGNWTNTFSHQGVHLFHDGAWTSVQEPDDPLMLGVNDFGGGAVDPMAVSMDPEERGHGYTGSYEEGVLEWRNGVVQAIWNATNSSLRNRNDQDNGLVDITGLDHDADGNLWVSNANCSKPIAVRKKDGTWRSFSPGGITAGNNLVGRILAATNDLKWLVRPRGQGLLVFSDGGTIDDTGDDQYKVLNTFENQGKLPTLDVFDVAEDQDGEIWVGTGKGVAVFYTPDAVFSGENFDCQQILIEQDGNVQILLETEVVSVIKVDGANRKWLGTQTSGVYLVSPDGTEQLAHFTVENSPLPSNNITSIAIDGESGEVFIGTDQGILGYRGGATEGALSASCASVFPNPVRPGYQGPVAITGLVADSDVRITDMAGNLVYKTTSLGGQALWPGTDLGGQRVASGVYLVLATSPGGISDCNTKVLVVR